MRSGGGGAGRGRAGRGAPFLRGPGRGGGSGSRGRPVYARRVPVPVPCSVCRLWRECARRTLRTRQRLAWVSALEPGPAESHALVRALARELEVGARAAGAGRGGEGPLLRAGSASTVCLSVCQSVCQSVCLSASAPAAVRPRGCRPVPSGLRGRRGQPLPAPPEPGWWLRERGGAGSREAARPAPSLLLQKVHVLPQTVLYIADAETFSGHEECHEQKKGNCAARAVRELVARCNAERKRHLPRDSHTLSFKAEKSFEKI